jgi:hypothetical protein
MLRKEGIKYIKLKCDMLLNLACHSEGRTHVEDASEHCAAQGIHTKI